MYMYVCIYNINLDEYKSRSARNASEPKRHAFMYISPTFIVERVQAETGKAVEVCLPIRKLFF